MVGGPVNGGPVASPGQEHSAASSTAPVNPLEIYCGRLILYIVHFIRYIVHFGVLLVLYVVRFGILLVAPPAPELPMMIRELQTRPILLKQLVNEVKGIYAGLVMVETKCREVDEIRSNLIDTTRFLEKIPYSKLIQLQQGSMNPHETVRKWLQKVLKAQKDMPIPKEEDVLEECLRGFLVALESRAKIDKWPEYEDLAALTTEERGEEGRKEVIDVEYFLAIGRDVVDQLMQDLEVAAAKAEKNFKEVDLDEAEAEEAEDAESNSVICAYAIRLFTRVLGRNGGLFGSGLRLLKSYLLKSRLPRRQAKIPPLIDGRALDNPKLYKMVGIEYYVRFKDRWMLSLNGVQWAALLDLHRRYMCEHYDFFLASQHPNASPALRRLASKYTMPTRLWNHGILTFLEILRQQLPDCEEFVWNFIYLAYTMMALLEETVPHFRFTWVEYKAYIAHCRYALEYEDMYLRRHWKGIAAEEYTRVIDQDPTIGLYYHKLAILKMEESDLAFDATISQLFYVTKSLVVKNAFTDARKSFDIIKPIFSRNKQKACSTDKDHFLSAVAHLFLACESENSKQNSLQAVHGALENIAAGVPGQAHTSRIRPSAELGLLLCQLLLGMSPKLPCKGGWTVMMVAWAPDLVTSAERADLVTSMADAEDIHDAIIDIIHTTVSYVLKEADTGDLGLWEFIYVLLPFMRSLETRPNLLKLFGWAFHAELLTPFLNMLLRDDETRGGGAWESASQLELLTPCSPLNQIEKPGKYGIRTLDLINNHAQNKHQKAEDAGSTDSVFTEPLPEHYMLRGNIFAREFNSSWYKYPAKPIGRKGTEVEETQLEDEEKESEDKVRQDKEQKEREAEEERQAEERQEELLRDPPLFPADWFLKSKYNYDERQVRQYSVQDVRTCEDRLRQILWLTFRLIGPFFSLQTDEDGRHSISVPGAPSRPPLDLDKSMPEVVKRTGGVRAVYVDPIFCIAEKKKRRRKEEKKRHKEKAEGNTEEGIASCELLSADNLLLRTHKTEHTEIKFEMALPVADGLQDTAERDAGADTGAATAPADDKTEGTKPDVVRLTKEVLDTIPLADEAAGRVISPTTVQGARGEDEDGWTHISGESLEDYNLPVLQGGAMNR